MDLHDRDLLQLLVLLAATGALLALAPLLRVPYPILLVLGGLALAFVPGIPEFELPPELVLVAFLPPLLYSSAFFTSLRDLRANAAPIGVLAVGLVLATTVLVAAVGHWVAGMPWNAAFVLGAVVSPTDPIAATAIARRLGVPRRVVHIVEGESLVNDATALVLYRTAVGAVVAGTFSLWEAGGSLVLGAAAGVAIGLAVGWVVRQVRRRLDHPPTEISIALLTPYLAYLPAEALGVSAVLAAVTVGIYMGWYTPELTTPETRIQGFAFWTILTFVMNAVLFTLIGLQLPLVLDVLDEHPTSSLVGYALAVCAAVILIRIVWMLGLAYVLRAFDMRFDREPLRWRPAAVVAWSGLRGAVSLAAALAIPLSIDGGTQFPQRDLIVFLTFSVILATLVFQGLTLPAVIGVLGVHADENEEALEEAQARIRAAEAALARLDELLAEEWVRPETAERLRGMYEFRRERFLERFGTGDGKVEEQSLAYQRLRRELFRAEEQAIVELRNTGAISGDVANRVLRDVALEDVRLDA
jgi:CPA1 family monovalent cation:H+ antiporter